MPRIASVADLSAYATAAGLLVPVTRAGDARIVTGSRAGKCVPYFFLLRRANHRSQQAAPGHICEPRPDFCTTVLVPGTVVLVLVVRYYDCTGTVLELPVLVL